MAFLKPQDIEILDRDGNPCVFVMHRFPAIIGREILSKYPLSSIPKLGDYAVNEETMLKLMSHVGVRIDGRPDLLMLSTRALVDNHVPDGETSIKLEWEMLKYNFSFFEKGLNSSFFAGLGAKALAWISKTLIPSLGQLFPKAEQRSKNSAKTTR